MASEEKLDFDKPFGSVYEKYIWECVRDNTSKFEKGIVGVGTLQKTTTKKQVKSGSIIVEIDATKISNEEGEPFKFKMIFDSASDARKFLSIENGGSIFGFRPDRDTIVE